ncbi:ABC transporter substrate-binding protein [Polaromonas sp.]|uniref:ABC transporter substrate-binding protein n=1 Tax=Polaromonas sp. TaxID=1869339 RepID=UPI002486D09B|nr:ABC transporter substrate-binding protein [Polaromonas sp.]MDI1342450.1 ABC transporter substrate-binding protein [Polaromonas sp.]
MHIASLFFRSAALTALLAVSPFIALARDIVVGQVAPFGGPLAVSGRDFNLGAMIAFDEINAAGGIGGNRLKLVSRDDGYRSAETVRLVEDLIEQANPVALIGMWGAENIDAVLDKGLLDKAGLPVVGVRSGSSALRRKGALFHVRASYREEVQRILDQVQTMGSNRIAVIYEDTDFGREAWTDAQAALAKRQLTPLAVAIQPRNDLKVDEAVQKIAATAPQAVLLVANTPVAGAVIKGLRAKNSPAFIFTTSTVDAEQLVAQLGTVAAGVAVAQGVPNPYKATAPIAMEFKRRIATLGIDPVRANFASLEGYIVARIVGEGLRRSGKDPQRKDLVRGLESLRRTDLGGFMVDFGPGQREGSRFVDLSLIGSDGRIRQ